MAKTPENNLPSGEDIGTERGRDLVDAPVARYILHFDFTTGASGDKVMGALLEVCESLGLADLADLQALATALVPSVTVTRTKVQRASVSATSLTISESRAPHRHWSDIRRMIEAAGRRGFLTDSALQLALKTFLAIAEAEAAVHNQPIEDVHFHEVGAADSIVDVVGSCFLYDRLNPLAAYASPLTLGFGTFRAAHGEMSVPAPATARLINGLTVQTGPYEGEMTTPTGAALAANLVTCWQPFDQMRPLACGYGAGTREVTGASNTVRLLVGEPCTSPDFTDSALSGLLQSAALLEANIDHRSPEALAFACEELLAAGAMDVWQEPITMKKGRLAVRLALLCRLDQSAFFADRMLALTGSLGLRMRTVERVVLPRRTVGLKTPWGEVRFKRGRYAGDVETGDFQVLWLRPEHDEVARLARETGLDYQSLYDQLVAIANASLGLS